MEDTEKKKNTSKIVWGIVLGIVSLILCYMFVVLHFFYFAPNNISLKLKLWPFLSDSSLGEIYADATVELDFTATEDFETDIPQTAIGVNVREDGIILASYSDFFAWDGKQISVCTNSGKVFSADMLFVESNYNIAVLKCKNTNEEDETGISMPFVSLSSGTLLQKQVLSVSSPKANKNVWTGEIEDGLADVPIICEKEGFDAVESVMENCMLMDLYYSNSAFENGAVFDKSGNLIGLSYQGEDINTNEIYCIVMPLFPAQQFLSGVIEAYENETPYDNSFVEGFIGLDRSEIRQHMEIASDLDTNGRKDYFYFRGNWTPYTEGLYIYNLSNVSGYFLYSDFNYNEQKISKDNVITKIDYLGKIYEIANKIDLFNVLYQAKSGESMTFTIENMFDTNIGNENTVTIQI